MVATRAPNPQERVRFLPSVPPGPGLLADRGCRPLKPATRVRIPLGALTRPWCQRQHAGVPCLRCGFDPRRPLHSNASLGKHGALVLTGTRAVCTPGFGGRLPGAPARLAVAQRKKSAPPRRWKTEVRFLPASLDDDGRARERTRLIRRHWPGSTPGSSMHHLVVGEIG